jgi:hypothetical protein
MLIEITQEIQVAERLLSFSGVDEAVFLRVESIAPIQAQFEAGRSREDKLSAVQYVRFALPPEARRAFADASVPAHLAIDHPNYRHAAAVEGAVRASLCGDLPVP